MMGVHYALINLRTKEYLYMGKRGEWDMEAVANFLHGNCGPDTRFTCDGDEDFWYDELYGDDTEWKHYDDSWAKKEGE